MHLGSARQSHIRPSWVLLNHLSRTLFLVFMWFSRQERKKWSWNSSTLATWCKELTRWRRPWCWERLRAGGEEDDRGWDGWMASPIQWTWVWVSSGSWWWTGRPGVLWFMGSQRVGHDWATELNWSHTQAAQLISWKISPWHLTELESRALAPTVTANSFLDPVCCLSSCPLTPFLGSGQTLPLWLWPQAPLCCHGAISPTLTSSGLHSSLFESSLRDPYQHFLWE